MSLPYPLERGEMPLERYLLNLLIAIINEQGGEIRLTSHAIIKASDCSLQKSPSDKMDALVLRTSPAGAELYFATEAPPSPTSRKSRAELPATPHRQLTDLDLYLREQETENRKQEKEKQSPSPGLYPWTTRQ